MAGPFRSTWILAVLGGLLGSAWTGAFEGKANETLFVPVRPTEASGTQAAARLVQACDLVRAGEARQAFGVTGKGLCIAVLDTGLRKTHLDFAGKTIVQRNLTSDNGGDPMDASDGHGHGTHVAGIACANGLHTGVAPGADIAALKVLNNDGYCTFSAVDRALQWVLDNHESYNITVVNLSLVDGQNHTSWSSDPVRAKIQALRAARIPVVVSAGNAFFGSYSKPGMAYPAILPETISVGAVYDADVGAKWYSDGAKAFSTAPDRIAPFSQRLPDSQSETFQTDLLAPGAPMESAGISSDTATSSMQGTSQAAPMVSGAILLLQEGYLRAHGERPTVDLLEGWLRAGATAIADGDDEDDNVANTAAVFRRLDVRAALQAAGLPESGLTWLSEPSASPAPAVTGEVIEFSAQAACAGGETPEYRWDFGDGTSSSGPVAQHIYSESGRYTVTITTIVFGLEHSEAFPLTVQGPVALEIDRFTAKLNFAHTSKDCLALSGRLDPSQFSTGEGTEVRLDLGGVQAAFTLDARGKGRSATGALSLSSKGTVKLKLKGGSWHALWADEGLLDQTVQSDNLAMSVTGWIGERPFDGQVRLAYSAKAGRSGRAKSNR